jgi:glycosyltransferase involved in cell wall biosynthesis
MYASSDLFVFPSLSETFGNVVLEAMASGLPAIGFNVQGPKDIIRNNRTGILVDDINAEALASAIHELVRNQDRRREMGGKARDYAAALNWENIMVGLRRHYAAIVDKARTAPAGLCAAQGSVA